MPSFAALGHSSPGTLAHDRTRESITRTNRSSLGLPGPRDAQAQLDRSASRLYHWSARSHYTHSVISAGGWLSRGTVSNVSSRDVNWQLEPGMIIFAQAGINEALQNASAARHSRNNQNSPGSATGLGTVIPITRSSSNSNFGISDGSRSQPFLSSQNSSMLADRLSSRLSFADVTEEVPFMGSSNLKAARPCVVLWLKKPSRYHFIVAPITSFDGRHVDDDGVTGPPGFLRMMYPIMPTRTHWVKENSESDDQIQLQKRVEVPQWGDRNGCRGMGPKPPQYALLGEYIKCSINQPSRC